MGRSRTAFDLALVLGGSIAIHFGYYGVGAFLIGLGLL